LSIKITKFNPFGLRSGDKPMKDRAGSIYTIITLYNDAITYECMGTSLGRWEYYTHPNPASDYIYLEAAVIS